MNTILLGKRGHLKIITQNFKKKFMVTKGDLKNVLNLKKGEIL
tara:strand:- start:257 stop:385 length:129 start_codon:yes stop_codon:yes gene_type:complete